MKQTIAILLLILASYASQAQVSSAAGSQHMQLGLAEVVGASLFSSGSGSGGSSSVDMQLGGVGAMANGIESSDIQVNLQGTTGFDVSVQASSTAFTYTGTSTVNNTMLVKDVLSIMITNNNTGGNVAGGFSSYQSIDGAIGKKVIDQGQRGSRSFSFRYKANPGFNYAAGLYTTNIVYTITKI